MKREPPSFEEKPTTSLPNQFLEREIQRLEFERDALHRELELIHQSYAWRIVQRYRRFLERYRNNPAVHLYEKLATWILEKSGAAGEPDQRKRYWNWLQAHELTAQQIVNLKADADTLPYRPLIRVLLRVDRTVSESMLEACIASVRTQLYANWQLYVDDDLPTSATLDRCAIDDDRIIRRKAIVKSETGGRQGDVDTTAGCEFIAVLDPSSRVGIDALLEVVKRLNRNPNSDILYWDEDTLDSAGRRIKPFFKPDWSPNLLLSMNYLGESFVIRAALAENVTDLRCGFDSAQLYDLALRLVERSRAIVHIPAVLSHRCEETALPVEAANDAQRDRQSSRAIEEALQRRGEPGKVYPIGGGRYQVRYTIRDEPLVSILIPTRDKCRLLRQCIDSVEQKTDYPNYEIVVLDNDSTEAETHDYLRSLAGRMRVRRCPGRFNFSTINNIGASEAKGEYFLFLNNDTQIIRSDWMRALLEQAQRPTVGAVGAKLLFEDGRIQHAGVMLGIRGGVGHAFRFMAGNTRHYFGFSDVIRDCSAVTAACMMMRRSVFDEVGGFDENFAIEFTDIDLCLRLGSKGYQIVYTPLALLYHYESASRRRLHPSPDHEAFIERWGHCLNQPDPYYGRNLTLEREDWTIAS